MLRTVFRLLLATVAILLAGPARSQNSACDQPGEEPDVIVGDVESVSLWGTIGGVTAYSIGTDTCNIGTCQLQWGGGNGLHPVIGQNMFRLMNGRFEQIGQSWVKHVAIATNGNSCGTCVSDTGAGHLGVMCSDAYDSGLNGAQGLLGPKSEIQPTTGVHSHPFTGQGQEGNALYKRLQVANQDLDPALNSGAVYFVETQLIARDDAAAGNAWNNASYRRVVVNPHNFDLTFADATVREQSAIRAWAAIDPSVQLADIASQYVGGVKVSQLGSTWHYEYALQNLYSHDGVQSFRVPIPHGATVTNLGFHDVAYHSGEPYAGTDWTVTVDTVSDPNAVVWSTETFAQNPNANALRWGTLYNFRFDVDAAPATGDVSLVAFRPGGTNRLWSTLVPDRCGDGTCGAGEDSASCVDDCPGGPGAGSIGGSLRVSRLVDGQLALDWGESCAALDADYGVYEGSGPDFASHEFRLCSTGGSTAATLLPGSASLTYYLVVPQHAAREGSYGRGTDGMERPQAQVPCLQREIVDCGP